MGSETGRPLIGTARSLMEAGKTPRGGVGAI